MTNQKPTYYDPNQYLRAPGYSLDDLEAAGFEFREANPSVASELLMSIPRGVEGAVQGLYSFADFISGDALPDYEREDRIFGNSSTWYGGLAEGLVTFGLPGGFVGKAMGATAKGIGAGSRFARWTAAGAVTDFVIGDPNGGRLADLGKSIGWENGFVDYLATDPDEGELYSRLKNMMEGAIVGSVFDGVLEAAKGGARYFRARKEGKSIAEAERAAVDGADNQRVNDAHAQLFQEEFGYSHDEAVIVARVARMAGVDLDRVEFGHQHGGVEGVEELVGETLGQEARGASVFLEDGRAIIVAMEGADVTTGIHEIAHVARRQLFDIEAVKNSPLGVTEQMLKDAADFSGAKFDAGTGKWDWNVEAEEKFAEALEKYFLEGVAPSPELKGFFDKVAEFFRQVYNSATGGGLSVKLSDEMREVFDSLFDSRFGAGDVALDPVSGFPIARAVLADGRPGPDVPRFRNVVTHLGRLLRTNEQLELDVDSPLIGRERTLAGEYEKLKDGSTVQVSQYGNNETLSTIQIDGQPRGTQAIAEGVVLKDAEFWNPNVGKGVDEVDETPSFVRGNLDKEADANQLLDGIEVMFDPNSRAWITDSGHAVWAADEITIVGDRGFMRGEVRYWDAKSTPIPTPKEGSAPARVWEGARPAAVLHQKKTLGSLRDELQVRTKLRAGKGAVGKPVAINGALNDFTEARIDWAHKRTPVLKSKKDLERFFADVFGGDKGLPILAPNAWRKDGSFKTGNTEMRSLSKKQWEGAKAGIAATKATRQALFDAGPEVYQDPNITGYLLYWSINSRKATPAVQEAAFVDTLAFAGEEFDDMLARAARGEWSPADTAAWQARFGEGEDKIGTVLPEGSPSRGVTMNVNSFGPTFSKKGKLGGMLPALARVNKATGKSRLVELHEQLFDPKYDALSGADKIKADRALRRWYLRNLKGSGIDTKAFSFMMLVAGRHNVMVIDRIQARRMFQDGSFGWVVAGKNEAGVKIYDQVKNPAAYEGTIKTDIYEGPGQAISQLTAGSSGIAFYEAVENTILANIRQSFDGLDVADDEMTMALWHWATWVAEGKAEVEHGTLDAIQRRFIQKMSPRESVYNLAVPNGRHQDRDFGWAYAVTPEGREYRYRTTLGRDLTFDVDVRPKFIDEVGAVSVGSLLDDRQYYGWVNPINPSKADHGFSLKDASERPWQDHDIISREAHDALAFSYSRESGQEAATSTAERLGEDGAALFARESARLSARSLAGYVADGAELVRSGDSLDVRRTATESGADRVTGWPRGVRAYERVDLDLSSHGLGGDKLSYLVMDGADEGHRSAVAGLGDGEVAFLPTGKRVSGGFAIDGAGQARIIPAKAEMSVAQTLREMTGGMAMVREQGAKSIVVEGVSPDPNVAPLLADLARLSELEPVNAKGAKVLYQGSDPRTRNRRIDPSLPRGPLSNFDRISVHSDLNIISAQAERTMHELLGVDFNARDPRTLHMARMEGIGEYEEMMGAYGQTIDPEVLTKLMSADVLEVRRATARLTAYRAVLAQSQEWTMGNLKELIAKAADSDVNDREIAEALRRLDIFANIALNVRKVQSEVALSLGAQRIRIDPKDFNAHQLKLPPPERMDATSAAEAIKKAGGRDKVMKRIRQLEAMHSANPYQPGVLAKSRGVFAMIPEYFINNILSGWVTHSINFVGGVTMNTIEPLERALGAAITMQPRAVKAEVSELVNMVTSMHDTVRIAGVALKTDTEQVAKGVGSIIEGDGRNIRSISSAGQGVEANTVYGKSLDYLGVVVNIPGRLMMGGDQLHKAAAARARLSRRLTEIALDKYPGDPQAAAAFRQRHLDMQMESGQALNIQAMRTRARNEANGLGLDGTERDEFISAYLSDNFDGDVYLAAHEAFQVATERTFTNALQNGRGQNGLTRMITSKLPGSEGFSFREQFAQLSARVGDLTTHQPWLKLVLPFIRTPANIALWTTDRTFGAASDALAVLISKNAREAMDPEGLAALTGRLATGVSLMGVAAYAASNADDTGIPKLTGAGPLDPNVRKAWEATGWKPYSLRVGDKWVQYKRIDPVATILGVVADMMVEPRIAEYAGRDPDLGKAIMVTLIHSLTDKTYMKGLTDALNVAISPEQDADYFWNSYTGAFMPGSSFVNQSYVPFVEGDTVLREVRTRLDAIRSRFVFADRSKLAVRRNALGEELKRDSGVFGRRDPISPIRMTGVSNDKIASELVHTGAGLSAPSSTREGVDWLEYTNDEGVTAFDRFQELTGTTKIAGRSLRQSLDSLVKSKHYQSLSMQGADDLDSPRAQRLKRVLSQYRRAAARQVKSEFPELQDGIQARRLQAIRLRSGQ